MIEDDAAVAHAGPAAAPPLLDTPGLRNASSCPLCAYSLRGLADLEYPRCPECGYEFNWPELIRARQRSHPYLFEHHPRRNVGSFVRTLAGGMLPGRFWSSLHAGHEIRPGRLVAYWLVVASLTLLGGFGGAYVVNFVTQSRQQSLRIWQVGPGSRSIPPNPQFALDVFRFSIEEGNLERYLLAAALAWPWLTIASLLVFQASMRRAKVSPGHICRCAVYCGDAFLWWGPALVVLGLFRWLELFGRAPWWNESLAARQTVICFVFLLAPTVYRLGVAYRRYLRFDRPWATVLASQVVVLLFLVTALSLAYDDFWRLMPPFALP